MMNTRVNGFDVRISDHGNLDSILRDGHEVLYGYRNEAWALRHAKGQITYPSDCRVSCSLGHANGKKIEFHFSTTYLRVYLEYSFDDEGLDVRVTIENIDCDTIKYVYVPDGLEFNIAPLRRFLYPKTYGVSLNQSFFEKARSLATGYPGPIDFMYLDSHAGNVAFFGVQQIRDRHPYDTEEPVLVPGRLRVNGERTGHTSRGVVRHGWNVWIPRGDEFTTPWYRMVFGRAWDEALEEYALANQITRTLEEKIESYGVAPAIRQRLDSALTITVDKDSAAEMNETIKQLPSPAIVHYSAYLPNGFDRYYPIHLPPSSEFGDEESLRMLHSECSRHGHLSMPYTNYTWWCLDSPALEEHGDAGLQLRLDGHPLLEFYYDQSGYAASQWSSAHREIMVEEVKRFKELGADLIMIDQMSARPFHPPFMTEDYWWDRNEECPVPFAAAQGMADAAKRVSQILPLSTEVWDNGPIDYLMNWVTQFCGFAVDGFSDEDMSFFPLCQALGHDKSIFTWHDLAPTTCCLDDYRVTLSLLLGFQLNYVPGARGEPARDRRKLFHSGPSDLTDWPDEATKEWINWLSNLSRSVVKAYIGKPLTDFAFLQDKVFRVAYGDVSITANLSRSPIAISAGHVIAPHGFHADWHAGTAGLYWDTERNMPLRSISTE